MGISHTAVHTYFANRNELVNAIAQRLATEMFKSIDLSDASPRGLIIAMATAARRSLARHPRLIPAFLTLDSESVTGKDETTAVLSVLESGGVPKDQLPMAYRVLENYVFGATIFDFGSAPDHLLIRRRRYKDLGSELFLSVCASQSAVAKHNDESFLFGLERLLDGLGLKAPQS